MSGKCDNCNEHCLDCKCVQKGIVFNYLQSQDAHLTNIIKWIDMLLDIQNGLTASGMDDELYDSVDDILELLYKEAGIRTVEMFT